MEFQIIASSSKGNCYMVKSEKGDLLIEAGISFKRIQEALDFDFINIKACLLSHEHKDHSKAIKQIIEMGIDVYTSAGTIEALGIESNRLIPVQDKIQFSIPGFNILPFNVQHDCAEPLGFMIQENYSRQRLLFATDTYYIRYKFSGLTHIAVECNYSDEILQENVESGRVPEFLAKRVRRSHFEINKVRDFIQSNVTDKLKNVYLLHLSTVNSDAELFERHIRLVYGFDLVIANPRGGNHV